MASWKKLDWLYHHVITSKDAATVERSLNVFRNYIGFSFSLCEVNMKNSVATSCSVITALLLLLGISNSDAQIRRVNAQPAPRSPAPAIAPAPTVEQPDQEPPVVAPPAPAPVSVPVPQSPPPSSPPPSSEPETEPVDVVDTQPVQPDTQPDKSIRDEGFTDLITNKILRKTDIEISGMQILSEATTEDIPDNACTIVRSVSNLQNFIILNGAGKVIPDVKSLLITADSVGGVHKVECKLYAGVFEPTNPEVVVWLLHKEVHVDDEEFQKLIDASNDDFRNRSK